MSKNDSPCYQCSERYSGCHGKCEKYSKWREHHILEQRKIRSAIEAENAFHSYNVESGERIKRMRKGKRK